MTIINQRWPSDLCPKSCVFGRTRNDVRQASPVTRRAKILRRGRPLWAAKLTWEIPNGPKLAKLRYWLEALDGYGGSVQLWDFTASNPPNVPQHPAASLTASKFVFVSGAGAVRKTFASGGLSRYWVRSTGTTLAASVGSSRLYVSGTPPNSVVCVQGQYLQVGRRLYVAAEDATSDPSGSAEITIVDPVVTAVLVGTIMVFRDPACEMQLVDQNFEASSMAGDGAVTVSASFIETVEDVQP